MLQIRRAETDAHFATGRALFEEYATSLGIDLSFQNFAEELTNLASQYGAPEGCLLLAFDENQITGCVALRRLDTCVSEMPVVIKIFGSGASGRDGTQGSTNFSLSEAESRSHVAAATTN